MLYLMGMRDDLIGMRYRAKFIIQTLCGLLLVASGFVSTISTDCLVIYELPYLCGHTIHSLYHCLYHECN